MTRPDTPFPKHWLYYIVLKYAVIAEAVLIALYIASQLYGRPGAVTGPVAVFIGTGILVSYWGLLLIAAWIRGRMGVSRQEAEQYRRAAWNRSLRDSRHKPGESRSDPIERLFVATAIVSLIAFVVWFAFFAGSPFPTTPG